MPAQVYLMLAHLAQLCLTLDRLAAYLDFLPSFRACMYVTSLSCHRVIRKVRPLAIHTQMPRLWPIMINGACRRLRNEGPRARISRRCKLVCISHAIYATGWACFPPCTVVRSRSIGI
ncbi:hypothetical protein C2E23DRAFT_830293, partial [Lenzites betulinus]